jgi:polyhydroxybutyrate depolymerase
MALPACGSSGRGGGVAAGVGAGTPALDGVVVTSDKDGASNALDAALGSDGGSTSTAADAGPASAADVEVAKPDTAAPKPTGFIGGERPAKVYVPKAHTSQKKWPLLLLLHGFTASGGLQNLYMGISNQVNKQGVILVTPDGNKDKAGLQYWNATPACCDFGNSGVDDVAYLTSLIDEAIATYNADPKRVYLLGHSNGAFMAYRMACDRADKITAIASLAGATFLDDSKCKPSQAVNVLQIHGTLDPVVGYLGGNFFGKVFPGAEESVAKWRKLNDCDGPATNAGKVSYDYKVFGNETSRTLWKDCKQGVEVGLWKMSFSTHVPVFTGAFQKDVVAYLLARTRQ